MSTTVTTDQWPGWAKALIIGQFALILAVLLPWLLMWTGCIGMGMGMGDMQRMMELMPRR